MRFIQLRKCNEGGESTGKLFVNPELVITIEIENKITRLGLADGHCRWVLDTPEEIVDEGIKSL